MNGPIRGVLLLLIAGCSLVPPEPGAGVYLYRPLEGISPGEIVRLHSERSLDDLNSALAQEPTDPALLEERAWSYAQGRKFKAALEDLSAAIKLLEQREHAEDSITIARLLTRRGLVYRALGEAKKAEEDFTAAIERDPENWEHYFHRWQLRLENGDQDAADEDKQTGQKLQNRAFEVQYSSKFGAI